MTNIYIGNLCYNYSNVKATRCFNTRRLEPGKDFPMAKKILPQGQQSHPLSMSETDNSASAPKRPPLRAADEYRFDLQHYIQEDGTHYYSVQDWIAGVAKTSDTQQASTLLQNIKKRAGSVLKTLTQLPYRASDGKTYRATFADEKTIYGITQHMRANTGIRDAVLEFLSDAGVTVGDVEQAVAKGETKPSHFSKKEQSLLSAKISQGYSEDEAKTFLVLVKEGKVKRRQWTDVLKLAVRGNINYGRVTNVEYLALFNMTAEEIRAVTGFNIARDGMTPTGRAFVTAAELALEAAFNQHRDLTFQQALGITRQICEACGISVKNIENILGISLATGIALLKERN